MLSTLPAFGLRVEAFVPASFRDAASSAPVIVMVDVEVGPEGTLDFRVIEFIRGSTISIPSVHRRMHRFSQSLEPGSTYLLLVSSSGAPYARRPEPEWETVNALEVVDGAFVDAGLFMAGHRDKGFLPLPFECSRTHAPDRQG